MAFVPGFKYDLFISYAHGDNESLPPDPGWAGFFEHGLRITLRQLLGIPPEIFLDNRKLGGEMDFSAEIRSSLSASAALLAVVSPSYLQSLFCRKEREWFVGEVEKSGGLKVGNRFRMVKVVRLPAPENRHRLFLKDQLGFELFEQTADGVRYFTVDTVQFRERLLEVAEGIAGLLVAMRNQRQSVYLAEGALDLADKEHAAVKAELVAHGFRVLPEYFVEDEDAVRADLSPASLSVHLVSGDFHPLTKVQVDAARELSKPMIVWLSPGAAQTSDPRQASFLRELADPAYHGRGFTLLERTPVSELKTIVLDQLRPRIDTGRGNGKPHIYLVCDRSQTSDVEQAWQIRKQIIDREGFDVSVPEGLREDHRQKLASCEGVLLYWGEATTDWYEESRDELRIAPRLLRSQPFRSEKIYLTRPDDPIKSEVCRREGSRVLRQGTAFSLADLEPFLAPLRAAGGAGT